MNLQLNRIHRWVDAACYNNPLIAAMSPNRGSVIRVIGYFLPLMIVAGVGIALEGDKFFGWGWILSPPDSRRKTTIALFFGLFIIISMSALLMLAVSLYYWRIYGEKSFQAIRLPVTNQLTPPEIFAGLHVWPGTMTMLCAATTSLIVFAWINKLVLLFASQNAAQDFSMRIRLFSLGCAFVMYVLFSIMYCVVQWIFPANRSFRPWEFIGSLGLFWVALWCIARILHAIIIQLDDFHFMCFEGSTVIETPAGPTPISQIQPGQSVVARNLWTGELQTCVVVKSNVGVVNRAVKVQLDNGETITSTHEHRWRVRKLGWVASKRLIVGDVLVGYGGNSPKVWSIVERECDGDMQVYTIGVSGARSYFIGQSKVLVHNKTIK